MDWNEIADTTVRGVLSTVSDRLDTNDRALFHWLEEIGAERVLEIASGDAALDIFFEILYAEDGGSEEAEDALAGSYERSVGPPIDRVEDAFLAWRDDQLLNTPISRGPRSRPSALALRLA